MTSAIAEFIAARLAEDESAAMTVLTCCRDSRAPWPPEQKPGYGGPALTAYLRHFSETRALRDVAAKRKILEHHQPGREVTFGPIEGERYCVAESSEEDLWYANPWPCSTLEALAECWSDHPDYAAAVA